jgi:hypothetical protein
VIDLALLLSSFKWKGITLSLESEEDEDATALVEGAVIVVEEVGFEDPDTNE